MNRRIVYSPIIILLLCVIACTSLRSIPIATPVATMTNTPTITFTSSSTNTPTVTFTPIPTILLKNGYIIPVEFTQPILLQGDQFTVTVTGVHDVGDSVGGTTSRSFRVIVSEKFRDSHYLLQLELTVENLTNSDLGFGTTTTDVSLAMKLDDSATDFEVPAGWCDPYLLSCSNGFVETVFGNHSANFSVLFLVPNETQHISLYLLGPVPLAQP
jgi:hypothetical protein